MKTRIAWMGMLAVAVLLWAEPAMAQEGEAVRESFATVVLKNSGFIGWMTWLLSLAGGTLIIFHFINLKKDKVMPEHVVVELNNLLEEEKYEEALQLCAADGTFVSRVVAAGLNNMGGGYEHMSKAMQETGEEQAMNLMQGVSWLNLIAAIAPMMGLLGTVLGMIEAFGNIKVLGATVTPADLAGGIEGALVTTFIGLVVAIPMLSGYFYFRNVVEKLSLEVGLTVEELMARFRHQA